MVLPISSPLLAQAPVYKYICDMVPPGNDLLHLGLTIPYVNGTVVVLDQQHPTPQKTGLGNDTLITF